MPSRGMTMTASGADLAAPTTPQHSLRPMPRPGRGPIEAVQIPNVSETVPVLRPRPRPEGLGEGVVMASSPEALPEILPEVAPEETQEQGKTKRQAASANGSVCGDPEIKGEVLAAIRGMLALVLVIYILVCMITKTSLIAG